MRLSTVVMKEDKKFRKYERGQEVVGAVPAFRVIRGEHGGFIAARICGLSCVDSVYIWPMLMLSEMATYWQEIWP